LQNIKLYNTCGWENIHEAYLPSFSASSPKPRWFFLDQELARIAVEVYKDSQVDCRSLMNSYSSNHSPSFGFCRAFDVDIYYEALISSDSIDEEFWLQLLKKYSNRVMFLASLPDDKDLDAIHGTVLRLGGRIKHIALEGTRGYLSYTKTLANYGHDLAGVVSIDSPIDLSRLLENIAKPSDVSAIYALGTQTYIRAVKAALNTLGVSF
jgi:hypothetical protein